MALSINTNVPSLQIQQRLGITQSRIDTSLERLSTGLRINSAKDDAAGLAIATRLSTQILGIGQAIRNSNDAVSLFQLGESALNEITNNLQRIRELAVSSANGTLNASDRQALDAEAQQRLTEVNRIASGTDFNSRRLLDGSAGEFIFQIGPDVGNTLTVSLNSGVKNNQIGQIASQQGSNPVSANALTSGSVTITIGSGSAISINASVAGSEGGQGADSAYAKAIAINESGVAGLTVEANTVDAVYTLNDVTAAVSGNYSLTINGQAIYTNEPITLLTPLAKADIASEISANSGSTGVTADFDGTEITLSVTDARNIEITQTHSGTSGGLNSGGDIGSETTRGYITVTASEPITLGGTYSDIGFTSATISLDTSTLAGISLATADDANEAIFRIDSALASVSSLRSEFGQFQSAFESVVSSLDSQSLNLSQARSRIQDADFAAETLNLTRNQILRDASVTLLAQANISPRQALQLLENQS